MPPAFWNRRAALKTLLTSTATVGALGVASACVPDERLVESDKPLKNNIKQSVSRWCYQDIPLDQLCAAAARIGLQGIDLLEPKDYDVPRRYGLRCTMGYAADIMTIPNGLNRRENHAAIEKAFRVGIPQAAKAGVPNVIAFSGNRRGMSDAEGADNAVAGLNRVKRIAEDYNVTICVELLNSKVDHPDYMADHTAWGVRVAKEVASPRVKLLYDIYHMQIMEGDLIDTIRKNIQWIGHFHTGGVPGRHNLDGTQEVNWQAVARSVADLDFQGYFAHEFVPVGDPLTALAQAVRTCTV